LSLKLLLEYKIHTKQYFFIFISNRKHTGEF